MRYDVVGSRKRYDVVGSRKRYDIVGSRKRALLCIDAIVAHAQQVISHALCSFYVTVSVSVVILTVEFT